MSAPASASEATDLAPSLQDESSSGVGSAADGIDDKSAAVEPRRGSRTRKPTSRAAGLEPTEIASASHGAQQKVTRSPRKRKADDVGAEQEETTEHEVATVFEKESTEGVQEDADEKRYCICHGRDDGTFMISCERCQNWLVAIHDAEKKLTINENELMRIVTVYHHSAFVIRSRFHTKCIGITQKAAKKLDEYICEACSSTAAASDKGKCHHLRCTAFAKQDMRSLQSKTWFSLTGRAFPQVLRPVLETI